MTQRAAFGAELRCARERRGLTLDAIAEQTKVSAAHFAGLEQADLSRWPPGIFRRGFVRSYALAVGLDPEETLARFSRLFPDPAEESTPPGIQPPDGRAPAQPVPIAAPADERPPGFRLALEQPCSSCGSGVAPVVRRILPGLIDISLAVLPAALIGLAVGVRWFWPATACIAVAGHLACLAALGTTPGGWLMARLTAPPAPAATDRVTRRRIEIAALSAPRRHVPRHAAMRPAEHSRRLRH